MGLNLGYKNFYVFQTFGFDAGVGFLRGINGSEIPSKINVFKAYAESFRIAGYRPTTLAELARDLRKAIASRELAVVEIRVDPRVNERLMRHGG